MTMPLPSPDLLLARRAAAGHPEAWSELLALYGRKIYNLAFHFTGAQEEAEDLTQEIFLRLHRNLKLYRGDVPLAAWTLRLSRNLCIDNYRRLRREQRSVAVPDELLEEMPAADDLSAEALQRERLRTVYRALDEIAEDLAEVVVLFDLQGWSLEETATYLGVPVGTIKSRLHRARLALADRVAALTTPAARPKPPVWLLDPRYTVAASLVLTVLLGWLAGNPAKVGNQALDALAAASRRAGPPLAAARAVAGAGSERGKAQLQDFGRRIESVEGRLDAGAQSFEDQMSRWSLDFKGWISPENLTNRGGSVPPVRSRRTP